jgi:hypothetical protein
MSTFRSLNRNLLTFLSGNGKIVLYLLERASTELLETLQLVPKLIQASLNLGAPPSVAKHNGSADHSNLIGG